LAQLRFPLSEEAAMRGNTELARHEQHEWLERWLPDLRAELEALNPNELIPVNIDVGAAISTVHGVLPKLKLLRDRIAKLPEFDLAAFDRLELYTLALTTVHVNYVITAEPPDHLAELVERATLLREQLMTDAKSLVLRGHLDPASLRNLKTKPGFKALAFDVLGVARVLRAHWPTIADKCPASPTDLAQAESLAAALMTTIGRRQFTHAIAVAAQLRLRTFTLFIRTYTEARRAVTFLCGAKTDPDSIAPSLYGGRKRRKNEKVKSPSHNASSRPEVTNGLFRSDSRLTE
jgi:hypothetical protein